MKCRLVGIWFSSNHWPKRRWGVGEVYSIGWAAKASKASRNGSPNRHPIIDRQKKEVEKGEIGCVGVS